VVRVQASCGDGHRSSGDLLGRWVLMGMETDQVDGGKDGEDDHAQAVLVAGGYEAAAAHTATPATTAGIPRPK